MSFEEWVQSLGIDPATLTEENRAALMLSYDALTNATPQTPAAPSAPVVPVAAESGTPPDPDKEKEMQAAAIVSAMNKAAAENKRRVAQIELLAAGHPAIAATAIEKGWSLVETENAVLKANAARTRPTSFRSAEKEFPQEQVLEAAVCMVRKTKNIEKDFKPEILQAAHSEFRGRVGLKQIMMIAACANGYHARPGEGVTMGNFSELLRYACPDPRFLHLQAASAFSTVSLPGIMSNVANKELLTGYMEEDAVWREICQIKSVSDFKQVTSYRMLDDMEFEELSPGGTIKQGKIGEESYTRQARTYAKMFTLERTQIINDDLGALDDLRSRLGRGYAKRLNKIFWTAFINNSTFFTTARTNYISGATSNLGDDGVGLGLGVTAFRKMTSPTGDGAKRVGAGLRPEILLVPPELEAVAERMYRNQNLGAGTKNSEANIYANKYRPLVAWQLSDSEYTGNSTTAWYLLSSPSGYPTIVVSFLDGVETPTVESADADFNTLGIQFRGYHDFGCDMAEYLGGLKSKGAS